MTLDEAAETLDAFGTPELPSKSALPERVRNVTGNVAQGKKGLTSLDQRCNSRCSIVAECALLAMLPGALMKKRSIQRIAFFFAGIMTALVATGCSSQSTGVPRAALPQTNAAAGVVALRTVAKQVPVTIGLGNLVRRSTSNVITQPGELQSAQVSFDVTTSGATSHYITFQFDMSVSTTLKLPVASDGTSTNTAILGDTVFAAGSCLEIKGVYSQAPSASVDTTRELHVYDTCSQQEFNLLTLDATASPYIKPGTNGSEPTITIGVTQLGKTWQILLLNTSDDNFDPFYDSSPLTANQPVTASTGVVFDTLAPGDCPIPTASAFTLWNLVASTTRSVPAKSPTPIHFSTPAAITGECFTPVEANGAPYGFTFDEANGVTPASWSFTFGSAQNVPVKTLPPGAIRRFAVPPISSFAIAANGDPIISSLFPFGNASILETVEMNQTTGTFAFQNPANEFLFATAVDDTASADQNVWSLIAPNNGGPFVLDFLADGGQAFPAPGFGHIVPGPDRQGWFVSPGANLGTTTPSQCPLYALSPNGSTEVGVTGACFHNDLSIGPNNTFWATAPTSSNTTAVYQIVPPTTVHLMPTSYPGLYASFHSVGTTPNINIVATNADASGLLSSQLVNPTTGGGGPAYQAAQHNALIYTGAPDGDLYYVSTPVGGQSVLCRQNFTTNKAVQCWSLGVNVLQPSAQAAAFIPGSTFLKPGPSGVLWLSINVTGSEELIKINLSALGPV